MVSGGGGAGEEGGRRGGGALLGAYEMGRTVGEGSFGKVKQARHRGTGALFAVKILDRARILSLRFDDQIRREIATLKLLKHPHVVRLHEEDFVRRWDTQNNPGGQRLPLELRLGSRPPIICRTQGTGCLWSTGPARAVPTFSLRRKLVSPPVATPAQSALLRLRA